MEGFGHEVVADVQKREAAFHGFDVAGGVFPDVVGGLPGLNLNHELGGVLSGGSSFVGAREERGEDVGSAVDASVGTESEGVEEKGFGADEEGPVGAFFFEGEGFGEVVEVARAVFEADDLFLIGELAEGVDFEPDLGERGHVVEHDREREFREEMMNVVRELGLSGWEIIGRGEDKGVGSGVGGVAGEVDCFDEGGVGDADEDGHAVFDEATDQRDEFATEAIGKVGEFSAGAEDEDAVDAAVDDVFDKAGEAFLVEGVAV